MTEYEITGLKYLQLLACLGLFACGSAERYDVVIVDNLSNSDMDAVEGVRRITGVEVPFEKADCCDRDAFRKVFEKYDFDSVIHSRRRRPWASRSQAAGILPQQPRFVYERHRPHA